MWLIDWQNYLFYHHTFHEALIPCLGTYLPGISCKLHSIWFHSNMDILFKNTVCTCCWYRGTSILPAGMYPWVGYYTSSIRTYRYWYQVPGSTGMHTPLVLYKNKKMITPKSEREVIESQSEQAWPDSWLHLLLDETYSKKLLCWCRRLIIQERGQYSIRYNKILKSYPVSSYRDDSSNIIRF